MGENDPQTLYSDGPKHPSAGKVSSLPKTPKLGILNNMGLLYDLPLSWAEKKGTMFKNALRAPVISTRKSKYQMAKVTRRFHYRFVHGSRSAVVPHQQIRIHNLTQPSTQLWLRRFILAVSIQRSHFFDHPCEECSIA